MRVTLDSYLQTLKCFYSQSVGLKVQVTPNRAYLYELRPTNTYWQDWTECLEKYSARLENLKMQLGTYFSCLEKIKYQLKQGANIFNQNVRFFLRLSECIGDSKDFERYVQVLLESDHFVTPILEQIECSCK